MGTPEQDLHDYLTAIDVADQIDAYIRSRIEAETFPDYFTVEAIERYTEAECERLKDNPEAELWEFDDWHCTNIEHCTCAYCKAEWVDEYAESMEVLGNDNLTTWRTK